jgi:hypothetical protein
MWERYAAGVVIAIACRMTNNRIFRGRSMMAPLPFLDWPADLFAEAHAAAAPLIERKPRASGTFCTCGCNQKHNSAVSALEGDDGNQRVLWFRSIACKNRHMGIAPRTVVA